MAIQKAIDNTGVYWVGSDGNIYVKGGGAKGVVNGGSAQGNGSILTPEGAAWNGYKRIADPNPPRQSGAAAPTNPNASGGSAGGGGPARADRSNSIRMNEAGLNAVDEQTNSGLAAIDRAFKSLVGQYDTEAQTNEGTYKVQSDTNQTNLQKNKQAAYLGASQGLQGLKGVLASLGALSGDGLKLANNAVKKGANADLSQAADNFGENQSNVDTAINTFRQEDKFRRENAATAAENAKTNTRGDAAKTRMNLFSNLANDYSAQLDAGNAKKYTEMAASLYPEIAKSNVPNANLSYTGAAFTPATLQSYIAGADNTQVTVAPSEGGSTMPSLIARPTKKKQAALV